VRRDDGGEKFAGELVPEMVEEILQRAADTTMIVRRPEDEHIGAVDSGLQSGESGLLFRGVGIVKRQRFPAQVKQVDGAAVRAQALRDMGNDSAGDGFAMQAANDGQNVQRLAGHAGEVTGGRWQSPFAL